MNINRKILYLYSTSGCHLCELALDVLRDKEASLWLEEHNIAITPVDISESDELVQKYGVRIPVVALEGRADDLGWPFDQVALLNYLKRSDRALLT